MNKQLLCGWAIVLWAAAPLWAAPVINGGTHNLPPNAVTRVAITVSGAPADQVAALNFYVQIGDGGMANRGLNESQQEVWGTDTAPTIRSLDIIGPGTVFYANNAGADPQPLRRTMTWTGTNGNWTDSTWTSSPPAPPNDSADVVINPPNATPYTVTVNTPQRAYSVDVSNGGHLTVAAGSLTVVTGLTYGTQDPENDTPGTTTVQAGASLTAPFIRQDTLNINGTATIAANDPRTPLVWYASIITETGTLRADGTLAYLDIDTTGATPGNSYALRVQAVADKMWSGGLDTDFGLVTPTLNDGLITVQNPSPGATPAPEPATLALVVLGGLCLNAYAWRRRLHFWHGKCG
jgi:hypothetical protein